MPAFIFDLVDDLEVEPAKRDAIEQGADFNWVVRVEAADIVGTTEGDWAARMQVRRQYVDRSTGEPLASIDSELVGGVTLSLVNEKLTVNLHLSNEVTGAMPIGRWYYDVELERLSDGYVRRLVEGRAQVKGEVTR